jgi:hypothetical protein
MLRLLAARAALANAGAIAGCDRDLSGAAPPDASAGVSFDRPDAIGLIDGGAAGAEYACGATAQGKVRCWGGVFR